MRKARQQYGIALALCSIFINSSIDNIFAHQSLQIMSISREEADEFQRNLKSLEELYITQQKEIQRMEALAREQYEQIQSLKRRLDIPCSKSARITIRKEKAEALSNCEVVNHTKMDSITKENTVQTNDVFPVTNEVRDNKEQGISNPITFQKKDTELSISDASYTPEDSKYSLSIKTIDDTYSLNIGGRIQMRYQFLDNDEDFARNDSQDIDLRRARIFMGGNIYRKIFHYYWSIDADSFDVSLRDFYIYWTPLSELNAKVGYFKVPFNRQRITSSQRLLFQDRSIASDAFDQDRDYGVDIYGRPFNGNLEYHAALFQGAGEDSAERTAKKDGNIDTELMYVLSLRYNPFGIFSYYDETDLNYSQSLKATIGASVAINGKKADVKREDIDVLSGVVDFGLRYKGFAWDNEYYFLSENPESNVGGSVDSEGFFTQFGYFVIPKKMEIGTRYSFVDPNDDLSNDFMREYAIGVNYYFRGHRSKIQSDFGYFETDDREQTRIDKKFRLQYELTF